MVGAVGNVLASSNAAQPQGAVPGKHRLANITLLIGGYGVGQGSLFLAQTWLVVSDELALLALFGSAMSFAILATTIVEAGSITVLARSAASDDGSTGGSDDLWRAVSSYSIVRICLAALCFACALVLIPIINVPYYSGYAACASPSLLIWAINVAGVLDGRGRSGFSGAVGIFPYVASAVALLAAPEGDPWATGAIHGAALTLGYVLTVAAQYLLLRRIGLRPRLARVGAPMIRQSAITALQMLATLLPGQLFFRLQLVLSGLFLGVAGTALLIYAYQVIAAVAQLIGFLRRIEFPGLVNALKKSSEIVPAILHQQRLGSAAALLLFSLILIAGSIVATLTDAPASLAGYTVAWFSTNIVTSALMLALLQGAQAIGRFGLAALASNVGVLSGSLLSAALIVPLAMPGLAIAAAVSHMATSLVLLTALRKHKSETAG